MTTWKISGRVIDRQTGLGLSELRVEAWDKDLICDDLVGSVATDEQGAFQMTFDESYFRELFLDRQPDLFFKIFDENNLLASTEDLVLWNIKLGESLMTVEVDKSIGRRPLNLSGPIKITLPAKVAYDLEALQLSIEDIMERLGCKPCFSGANCTFGLEREWVINPAAKFEASSRPVTELFAGDLRGERIGGVNAVLAPEVSDNIDRVKEAVAHIVERLGCPQCHSGFDIAFRQELDLITVDKEMNVQKFGRI
jgi:hypothetical protein